jgi:hypothetical protein
MNPQSSLVHDFIASVADWFKGDDVINSTSDDLDTRSSLVHNFMASVADWFKGDDVINCRVSKNSSILLNFALAKENVNGDEVKCTLDL